MRPSVIKQKLGEGKPVFLTQLHLTDASVFEMVSVMGFDGIWMDLEHHGYSLETAENLIRSTRIGSADVLARPGKGEFMRMGRLLEMGAKGIMYPRCSNAEEAKMVVEWAKFAPLGKRGFDGSGADAFYTNIPIDEYVIDANNETFLIIQLEDPDSIKEAEKISAIDGVDAIMLGQADFSVLSCIPGQFDHPLVKDALKKVASAAANTGKHWACAAPSPDAAKELIELGARIILHNADICILKEGFEKIRKDFSEAGFHFQNNQF